MNATLNRAQWKVYTDGRTLVGFKRSTLLDVLARLDGGRVRAYQRNASGEWYRVRVSLV